MLVDANICLHNNLLYEVYYCYENCGDCKT
jgi:hypothetical protein